MIFITLNKKYPLKFSGRKTDYRISRYNINTYQRKMAETMCNMLSKDGESFSVPLKVAKMSSLVKTM